MEVKAILWDSDGTLLYGNESFKESLIKACAEVQFKLDEETARQFLRSSCSWNHPEIPHAHLDGEGWWQELLTQMREFCLTQGIAADKTEIVLKSFRQYVIDYDYKVYSDSAEVLRCFKSRGIQNYIISNNFPELHLVFERLGLGQYIDGYFTSADMGYDKPHSEIFTKALKSIGLWTFKDSVIMIGDNPIADVAGADAVGISAILVHNKANACRSVDSLRELVSLITD